MAVLIDNMNVPKFCGRCIFYNTDGHMRGCLLYSNGIPVRYNLERNEKPDWCKLRSVEKGE